MASRVLLAYESETIRQAMARLLDEAGYQVTAVGDGPAALQALAAHPGPDALVLDVALPGIYPHELLERLRREQSAVRTVLVASVYNRAGYKRQPRSLYGADDYVEQHHIPDLLLQKLARLLGQPGPDGQLVDDAVERDTPAIRDAGQARLRLHYDSLEEGATRARRLAHLIIADVAMYHPDVHRLTASEREARLRPDLDEGRLLYELRVPEEIRGCGEFFDQALAEWLARLDGSQPAEAGPIGGGAAAAAGRGGGS